MRIIFMGTPEFGVPTFNRILADGHEIVATYTQPPRPAGRGQKNKKSPVQLAAEKAGVPVFFPKTLRNPEAQSEFESHDADLAIVVAYGLILPKEILDAPRYGCLNLHGSALPRWRGAAPIQRAIMAGDKSTAVQVMAMETGLDTGAICASQSMPIDPKTSAGDLHDTMMLVGADLMSQSLKDLQQGNLRFTPQSAEGVTYAKKIEKAEAAINWNLPAADVRNLIHGLSPFPGAWSNFDVKAKPLRVKILRAQTRDVQGEAGQIVSHELIIACKSGALDIIEVQRAGKSPMSATDFMRGAGSLEGQVLKGQA